MVDFIYFELCKADGSSRYIKFFNEEGDYYLETASGFQGMYIVFNDNVDMESNTKMYSVDKASAKLITKLVESFKVYCWPKSIPKDYTPRDRIIGCGEETWSLDYKELEKKNTRHIHGKGAFPKDNPYKSFYEIFIRIIPDIETKEWFLEEYEDGEG